MLNELACVGIEGGYAIERYYPSLPNTLLVCATELRTDAEIVHYAEALKTILEKDPKAPSSCSKQQPQFTEGK